uniref:hypothetical protein n=1 Tax=Alkalibacillus haloalkaliphilus TaxID=94136 RepID=UPI00058CFAFC
MSLKLNSKFLLITLFVLVISNILVDEYPSLYASEEDENGEDLISIKEDLVTLGFADWENPNGDLDDETVKIIE